MLIGVTGRAQHGKDSTGQVLVKEFGFKRYAFADQLKSMALVLNPYIPNEPYADRLYTVVHDQGWERAKQNPEVRRFLQVLGTEAVREHLGENAWVDALQKLMVDDGYLLLDEGGPHTVRGINAVVTDVRFENEAAWILNMGGKVWRIRRLNQNGTMYANDVGQAHASEHDIPMELVDEEITAVGLTELQYKVRAAGRKLKKLKQS